MQCPHCRHEFDTKPHSFSLGIDRDGTWQVASTRCPGCDRLIVNLCTDQGCTYPAWPATLSRPWLSDDVPPELAAEYHAAAQILAYSAEASAAMSRRLLHGLLARNLGAGEGSLAVQIETALEAASLPAYLKDALDTLSQVAKLDVFETKSAEPGTLAGAEPGEAEWLLDVLDSLFDFCFIQPAGMQRKVAMLEQQIGPLHPAVDDVPLVSDDAALAEDGEDIPNGDAQAGEPAQEAAAETDETGAGTDAPPADTAATAPVPQTQPTEGPQAQSGESSARDDRSGWLRRSGR